MWALSLGRSRPEGRQGTIYGIFNRTPLPTRVLPDPKHSFVDGHESPLSRAKPAGSDCAVHTDPWSIVLMTTAFVPEGDVPPASQVVLEAHATSLSGPTPAGVFWTFHVVPEFVVPAVTPFPPGV